MSESFDPEAFCEWLAVQDSTLCFDDIDEEWPNFPWDQMGVGITVGLSDGGESLYYKRDLRRAARGFPNND